MPPERTSLLAWSLRRPAWMLLTAARRRLAAENPRRFAQAWAGVMALSLAAGLVSVGLWQGAWALCGEPGNLPLMPAAAVTAAALLGPYRRAAAALVALLAGRERSGRPVVAAVVVAAWVLLLLGLKGWQPDWPTHLPAALQWLRPRPLFRALLLAPVWGGWAMLIVPQFCRPDDRTEPAVAAFARGCGPFVAAVCMGAAAAATVLYFNYLPWRHLSISVVAVAAAIGGGALLVRAAGGLCRRALLAANVLTQMAFYAAYLANRSAA
jgi:hypothetical protein